MKELYFSDGSVPVRVAARVYGKSSSWVRAGLISGWLKIGYATRKGSELHSIDELGSKYGRVNYYISPLKLYEDTGYIYGGKYEK